MGRLPALLLMTALVCVARNPLVAADLPKKLTADERKELEAKWQ